MELNPKEFVTGDVCCIDFDIIIDMKLIFANICHFLKKKKTLFISSPSFKRGALSQKGFLLNNKLLFWDNTRSFTKSDRKEVQFYIF